MTSEKIIDRLVALISTLVFIDTTVDPMTIAPSQAIVFGEFPFEVSPEEDLEVLRSSTFLINGQESILAITIDEKTLTPDELKDTHQQDDTALDHNGLFITDYEVFTFRIWIWMQFHDDSSRKAKRYRDGIKDLLRKTSKLGFIVENDKDSIYKVARLRTSLMELFYSKSGAVHIIGNDLEVTVIN